MDRRQFMGTSLTMAAASEPPRPQAERRRPNILFLMTDQQRFDTLGANGNSIIRTPNLDRLAEQAASLQNAFVQAPVCVPSRATFFTGRYPHSHRNRVNYTPLREGEVLMQEYLQRAGYQTASIGKLHYYPPTAEKARETGFDRVLLHDGVPFTNRFSDYQRWREQKDPQADVPYRSVVRDLPPGRNPFRMVIGFDPSGPTGNEPQGEKQECVVHLILAGAAMGKVACNVIAGAHGRCALPLCGKLGALSAR